MDHDWDHGMGINGEFSIDLVQPDPHTRIWPSSSTSTLITLGLQQTGQSSTYCC